MTNLVTLVRTGCFGKVCPLFVASRIRDRLGPIAQVIQENRFENARISGKLCLADEGAGSKSAAYH